VGKEALVDFEQSEKMTIILEMVNRFVRDELIPLESEMLHDDPAVLDAAVVKAQDKCARWGCGRLTIRSSTAGSASACSSTAR
jgi:hypothetical protein